MSGSQSWGRRGRIDSSGSWHCQTCAAGPTTRCRTSSRHMPSRSSRFDSITRLQPVALGTSGDEHLILGSVRPTEHRRSSLCSSWTAWHGPAIAETPLRLERAKSLAKQVCALAVAQTRCSCRRVRAGFLRSELFLVISRISSQARACVGSVAPASRSVVTVRNPMIFSTWDRR